MATDVMYVEERNISHSTTNWNTKCIHVCLILLFKNWKCVTVWMHTKHTTTCVGVGGAGVQPHPQKFWFGKNHLKSGQNLWKFGQNVICVKTFAQSLCVLWFHKKMAPKVKMETFPLFLDVSFFHTPKFWLLMLLFVVPRFVFKYDHIN